MRNQEQLEGVRITAQYAGEKREKLIYLVYPISHMGRRRKPLDIQEVVDRYAESALISAIRLRRYWISQGDNPQKATEKAVRQAVGMMASSGAPISRLIELFQELKDASDGFLEMLTQVENRGESERQTAQKA